MELGMVGLGRMGGGIAGRLLVGGHKIIAYDVDASAVQAIVNTGANRASSIDDLVSLLPTPATIWVMLPAGEQTEDTIEALAKILAPGSIVIDGGNSNYADSIRRAESLTKRGLRFLDVGISGGLTGSKGGYSITIGGDKDAADRLDSVFQTLASGTTTGYGHIGPAGAGHFAKMIHNGIEYALMEAYAEGFEILQAKKEFNLDLVRIGEIWRSGSVIRSWILDLIVGELSRDPNLTNISGHVEDTGTGRWAVIEAMALDVPTPAITLALSRRLRSRTSDPFGERLLAALRKAFGGHTVKHQSNRSSDH